MGPATGAGKGLGMLRRRHVGQRASMGPATGAGKGRRLVTSWRNRSDASMGPATGAGKGQSLARAYGFDVNRLQWGPPLGRERDPPRRLCVPAIGGASMGPATGAGKGLRDASRDGVGEVAASMGPATGAGKGRRRRGAIGLRRSDRFNGARHWGGKGTGDRDGRHTAGCNASMGPATGAGKGPTRPTSPRALTCLLQWGPPLGRERDGTCVSHRQSRAGASMGPATGAGKGHATAVPALSTAQIRFNGARHWGGKGTNDCERNHRARHTLQWGPPLGRERDP